jgi:replication fork clamp-binding protein CrfC
MSLLLLSACSLNLICSLLQGTDAMETLLGRVFPLRLGFVGVINRSQQDIISEKPIRQALKHEQEFFANHPIYRTIANRCGTTFLARTLNRVLMNHIRDCLPDLKVKINKMMVDAQMELQSYGDPLYDTKNSQVGGPSSVSERCCFFCGRSSVCSFSSVFFLFFAPP